MFPNRFYSRLYMRPHTMDLFGRRSHSVSTIAGVLHSLLISFVGHVTCVNRRPSCTGRPTSVRIISVRANTALLPLSVNVAEDTRGRKPAPIFDSENRRRFSTPIRTCSISRSIFGST